jgi:hypothetical protein
MHWEKFYPDFEGYESVCSFEGDPETGQSNMCGISQPTLLFLKQTGMNRKGLGYRL